MGLDGCGPFGEYCRLGREKEVVFAHHLMRQYERGKDLIASEGADCCPGPIWPETDERAENMIYNGCTGDGAV
jgi:hypothetical protein